MKIQCANGLIWGMENGGASGSGSIGRDGTAMQIIRAVQRVNGFKINGNGQASGAS